MSDKPDQRLDLRIYLQPNGTTDSKLLFSALVDSPNKSSLLVQLIMRGWINLLHGTTAEERSIQLKSMGVADDIVAAIEAMAPNPQLFGLRQRDAQALGLLAPASSPNAQPAETAQSEAVAPPPAPAAPAFSLPATTRLGAISEQGGLS